MVWTWAGWEPLQFYRRLGGFHEAQEGNALWATDWSQRLHGEETAAALAETGVTWITTHFFKGFGLDCEAEEIADTARLIANCHRHGIKVYTYLQYASIMPETICGEVPEAQNWGRRDWNDQHDGHPWEYGEQYWRHKPCANQPGVRAYFIKAIDTAAGISADGIWIDNLQADGCHCDACQQAFQAHLQQTISDPWQALGVRDLTRVRIPRSNLPKDPVFQAWIRFRNAECAESVRVLAGHVRRHYPSMKVAANMGIGCNKSDLLDSGVWLSDLAPLDACYAENNRFPRWEDNRIVSQHQPMSLMSAVQVTIVPGAPPPVPARAIYPAPEVPSQLQLRRCCAESTLFGGHALGGPWGLRGEDGGIPPLLNRDPRLRRAHRQVYEWYKSNCQMLAGSKDLAPIGILYSREALTADAVRSRQVLDAMAQVLLQHQLPFRYVLSDRLDGPGGLEGLSLLVLPHALPMADSTARQIRAFAEEGGGLLATGRTSLYDEAMRQRTDYALADLFGVSFSRELEESHAHAAHYNESRRVCLLPGEWGLEHPDGRLCSSIQPERIARIIRAALPPAALPEVLSPAPHVACAYRHTAAGQHVLGLVNYADNPVRNIRVIFPSPPAAISAATFGAEIDCDPEPCANGQWAVTLPLLEAEAFLQWPPT
jgi:hypothetical protein